MKWVQLYGSLHVPWYYLLWYWNENWPFPVLWPLLTFPNLMAYWVWHFNSIISKNFPQFAVIHIVKGFCIDHKTEVDVFLEFSYFLYDPTNVGNLISGSSVLSKPSLYISKFSIHVLQKPSLKDFKNNSTSIKNEHNCMVVWIFFGTVLLWDWNENWPSPVLWPPAY